MSRIGLSDLGALERDSDVPLYRQIADRLLELIADGVLIEGDPLPSGPELSRHFEVAPMTVREAINALKADGLVVSEKGRGTYVGSLPPLRVALKTLSIAGAPAPSLLRGMPELPDAEAFLEEGAAAEIKIESYADASVESRVFHKTARVTLLVPHGELAVSHYTRDWSGPLDDRPALVHDVVASLKSDLASIDAVRELVTARQPSRLEAGRLAMPREIPVLVTEHIGMRGGVEVLKAWTVRDSRFPIEIS